MILRVPSYYNEFSCIADKCQDNCCIGWEIDIDSKTMAKYESISGEFGNRLRSSITSTHGCNSFATKADGRCPFLNENNLCDIILTLGEENICDICTNHPRFFEWFGSIKEGGIGLSCEETARLILSHPFSIVEIEIPDEETFYPEDDEMFNFLSKARTRIIEHLQDESITIGNALYNISSYGKKLDDMVFDGDLDLDLVSKPLHKEGHLLTCNITKLLSRLLTLEQLDPNWTSFIKEHLARSSTNTNVNASNWTFGTDKNYETYLRNLAIYFIWRYFLKSAYDFDVLTRINLMINSVCALGYLFEQGKDFSLDSCATLAKSFSKEVEYSDINVDLLGSN